MTTVNGQTMKMNTITKSSGWIEIAKWLINLPEEKKRISEFFYTVKELLNEKNFNEAKNSFNKYNNKIELQRYVYDSFIIEYVINKNAEVVEWFLKELPELVSDEMFENICQKQHIEMAKLFAKIHPDRFMLETKDVIINANNKPIQVVINDYFNDN